MNFTGENKAQQHTTGQLAWCSSSTTGTTPSVGGDVRGGGGERILTVRGHTACRTTQGQVLTRVSRRVVRCGGKKNKSLGFGLAERFSLFLEFSAPFFLLV